MVRRVVAVRSAVAEDRGRLWALNALPNIGATADPTVPLDLPVPAVPPAAFPDLADVPASFESVGGAFVVAVLVDGADERIVGMGGGKPRSPETVEVLRVRVHPAVRRQGVGRMLMDELERRAAALGHREVVLDTATNQPEAVAFYSGLGYEETHREHRPEWTWTLVHFRKALAPERLDP